MPVIYVDVLLIINFMVNMVLLRASTLISGTKAVTSRLIFAALVGALSSLIVFVPFKGVLVMGMYKLLTATIMSVVAFNFKSGRGLLKDLLSVFFVSFIFSGAMIALYLLFVPSGMMVYNGVVYFDISATTLLAVSALSYLLIEVVTYFLKKQAPKNSLCEIIIYHNNKLKSIGGLLDSGSNLTEPFSHIPAMVCHKDDLEGILPLEFLEGYSHTTAVNSAIRMIPYKTIAGSGALMAFLPDRVTIRHDGKDFIVSAGCYIAVSPEKIGNEQYSAVINPQVMQQNEERAVETV